MQESFNKISSSVSMVIGGNSKAKQPGRPAGRGTPGPRGPGIGRGGSRVSRGGGMGTGRGFGRPPGMPPGGRSFSSGVNAPGINPKATQQKQKPSTGKTKQKTKKQKKGKGKDASMVGANFTSPFLI